MDVVRQNHSRLLLQFDAASADVSALLDTLHDEVLPQLQLELALTAPDIAWLSEWLSDTASVFRLLRRHKFIRPFILQDIRAISIWRIHVLRPILLRPVSTLFHCLPPPITDPLGRPMIFLRLASLQSFPYSIKDSLLQEVERLRLHLKYVRGHYTHTGPFPLQYLFLLDLDGVSIQNYNLDLCSWILTDIIPRYPGMFAAVFVLNYSWIHSGAWTLAKRVLPSSVITRIFFPSKEQLVGFCSAANLPAEYGGSLPTLDQIDDALRSPYQARHLPPPPPPLPYSPTFLASPGVVGAENRVSPVPVSPCSPTLPSDSTPHRASSTITLPPLSFRNPFFGYPTITSASNPHTIRHVQRGARELVRTLAVLWWRRWGRWVWAGTWAGACAVMCVLLLRIRRAGARPGERKITIGACLAALKALARAPSTWMSVPRAQT